MFRPARLVQSSAEFKPSCGSKPIDAGGSDRLERITVTLLWGHNTNIRMDIPLLSNPDFCGPNWMVLPGGGLQPKSLVTLKSLLSDRALTVKRPRQQPPSLIFTLPAEMLAEMFLQATAGDQDPSSMLIPMHFHFVLTQVCALWRAVAIHTPSLWCRVVLHLGGRTSGFGGITNLAKTCFERSRELPLALIITSSVEDSSTIPNLSMDLVLPVRHRIRHLELTLPVIFTESLFKLPRNSLKSLITISVTATVSGNDGPWFRSMSALDGAPLLESVKLSCARTPRARLQWQRAEERFDPYLAMLPWDRLTELMIRDLEVRHEDALYALELTTSLVRCAIDLKIIPPMAPPVIAFTPAGIAFPAPAPAEPERPPKSPKPITIPALLTLSLAVSGHNSAPSFFDRLILPSLESLSIKYKDRQDLPCATLTQMQTRSGSGFSLRKLTLANRTGDNVIPFLERGLAEALTLKVKPDDGSSGSSLLPNLRLLSLAGRWAEEKPPATWALATKAVVEMVRSRRRRRLTQDLNASPTSTQLLEGFIFGSMASVPPKKLARFEKWRSEGMQIRTVYIPPERRHLLRQDYLNTVLWQEDGEL
ncbi:F-box domain-containing protein [Mycena venus]|uniref:F-box domain-containing protein n=1 Tax=Mycena venus TaxID=2733690 RepID=A0A8H7DAE1_9AGAR|nr:F-box domain-containing protein [Mycena venus]